MKLSQMRMATVAAAMLLAAAAFAVPAPRDESFVEWARDRGRAGGLMPSPVNRRHLAESYRQLSAARKPSRLLGAAAPIPSSWDSRSRGWVSPVRNQGGYGTCWAFAALASLEAAVLKATNGAVTNDFSENHLATHTVGFQFGFEDGGYNEMATALLASWRDPLYEADDPYPDKSSKVSLPAVCHVQQAVWLPAREVGHWSSAQAVAAANVDIQRQIMANGAVAIGYYHGFNHYNNATGAHYLNDDKYSATSSDGGHAVALIGWDDNYPVENFKYGFQPPRPGAFLAKNSWGPSSGTNGCIWISYYDDRLCMSVSVSYPEPEPTNNYGRVFQYDPCGQTVAWNVYEEWEEPVGKENWCANVFTPETSGLVAAVGFYALSAGTKYVLRVHVRCGSDPASGEKACELSGVTETAGYVTVKLPAAVPFAAGEKFAAVLRLECPGTQFPLPVEATLVEDGFTYVVGEAHEGESFMSGDGVTWKDFHGYEPSGNFCIKAYTEYGSDGETHPLIASASPASGTIRLRAGEAQPFSVTLDPSAGEDVTCEWRLSGVRLEGDGTLLVLSPSPRDHGLNELTCTVRSGDFADTRSWTVWVSVDRCVDARRGDDERHDGLSWETPLKSIQKAVDTAEPGDRVLVGPGTYGFVDVEVDDIDIESVEGAAQTVITGDYRCVFVPDGRRVRFRGFTLTGADSTAFANGAGYYGGGARGGAYTDCVISNCAATYGGGAAYATLANCLVVGNRAKTTKSRRQTYFGQGGGAYACSLVNCTVADNDADYAGGGAVLLSGGGAIVNSVVCSNSCALGVRYWPDLLAADSRCVSNTLYGADAGFVSAPGDWHLAVTSPAIDCGDNAAAVGTNDLDGTVRIFGARVDLGCYEYSHVPIGWERPRVPVGATPEEEAAAVRAAMEADGFGSAASAAVATANQYARLSAWAESRGVSCEEAARSPAPLYSAAVGALAPLGFWTGDVRFTGIGLDGAGGVTLRLKVGEGPMGAVDGALLPLAFGIEAAAELTEGRFGPVPARVEGIGPEPEFTVIPTALPEHRFFRAMVR